MQSRIQFFKDAFEAKASTEDLKLLMQDDDSNTTFDNTPYLAELEELITEVTQFDDFAFLTSHLNAQAKPLQYL